MIYTQIGVIAGTPVDTKLGVDFVEEKKLEAVGISTASNPEEQNLLQYSQPDALTKKVLSAIKSLEDQGIFKTMIYCNSLSSAVDVDILKKEHPHSSIVTPLDIYRDLALKLSSIQIWAANGQCLATIEEIFYDKNPSLEIFGLSLLPVVKAIESQNSPLEIVERFGLLDLCREGFMGCQGLLLGCTHFPYLKEELKRHTPLDIIDPGDEMLKSLTG